MEAPLLKHSHSGEESPEYGGEYPPVTGLGVAWRLFKLESWRLWSIAVPIGCSILCLYGLNSTTQIFAGHIGNLELSAVAIALSVINNFAFGFLLGMGSALETLCGQAYGAGQVYMLGVYMQRSWIILLVTCVILSPIYIFATPILVGLGQEKGIAEIAGEFTRLVIPQMFSLAINFPSTKFLQAQSKVWVMAWIGIANLGVHVLMLWLFIQVFDWGLSGAAAALDISGWLIAVAQVVYIVGWCRDGWQGLSWLALKDMWAFVKLSIASAVMLCLEVWYMMVLVLLTGHLDDAEIAVGSISICMNINGWEAMVFIGLNAAISVRVANELGAGHPRATKFSVINVILTSLAIGLVFMAIILITKDYFAVIFTSSRDMQEAVSQLAGILGITMVLNSVQPVISGVAIGGGWQAIVAYINLGCYYIFGLPLGFLLGYYFHLGAEGIWIGMLCGTALQTLILLIIIWKTNWNKEAAQATDRVKVWGGQAENGDAHETLA